MTSVEESGVLTACTDKEAFSVLGVDKFFIIKLIITKSGSLVTSC